MKKSVCLSFLVGCLMTFAAMSLSRPRHVHAQSTGYVQQYVLEVNTQRGFSYARFMKTSGDPINLDDGTWSTEASTGLGGSGSFSVQEPFPDGTHVFGCLSCTTFTETFSQP